jgi:hypothetical protein
VEVGGQQDLSIGAPRQQAECPARAMPGSSSGGSRAAASEYSPAHASHIISRDGNGWPAGSSSHSRRSSPQTTTSWSGSASVASGRPGSHRSMSSATVSSVTRSAWTATAPFPFQIRKALASRSASG